MNIIKPIRPLPPPQVTFSWGEGVGALKTDQIKLGPKPPKVYLWHFRL